MHSHRFGFTLLLFCILLLNPACSKAGYGGASNDSRAVTAQAINIETAVHDDFLGGSANSEGSRDVDVSTDGSIKENTGQSRKLVKRAELHLRVENLESTEKPLSLLMEKYGAWPASTGIYQNSRNYNIRVPSDSYDAMLAELAGFGRLLGRTENAEDVTLRYYDLESRLATKRELLRTYQSYLAKAQSIDDIMTVESRIADLQMEIDHTGTQFRNLVSQIDYSTIFLEIFGPISAASYSKPTLGEKMRELFGSFGDVVSSTTVVLTGIIIYGIPAILIVVVLFWIFFGRIGLLRKLWRFASNQHRDQTGPGPETRGLSPAGKRSVKSSGEQ